MKARKVTSGQTSTNGILTRDLEGSEVRSTNHSAMDSDVTKYSVTKLDP